MVNKKATQATPQPAAVPQRKAPTATAKRPERPAAAGGGGQPPKAPTPQRAVTQRPNAMAARYEGLQKAFRETVAELRKVQWPDRQTTRNLTLVVIGMAFSLAAILGLLDAGLTRIIEWLVKL
jgi:preprotein translocase subunit SecE